MKHTYKSVKESFTKERYTLLSKDYINGSKKLIYKCPNGHEHSITYYNWNSGYRCPKCFNNKRKIDINYIKEQVELEGYVLLTTGYTGNKQRLDCICNKGHDCTITWAGWSSRGDRCNQCGYDRMALKQIGPNNNQWRGGIGRAPYCYAWQDKEFKEYIKIRDNYTCQHNSCGTDKDLVIHHVDYNKSNCTIENLITLCRGCNTRVNKYREVNTKIFRLMLSNNFGYTYEVFNDASEE